MTADAPTLRPSGCVDVLIPVWNNEATIERAIRSALEEPEVDRVIVIDDASPDGTAAVISAMIDRIGDRIHLVRLTENGGPAAARNIGLDLSKAPWVAILDGDDYFRAGRILALLQASDGADLVADDQDQSREDADDEGMPEQVLIGNDDTIELDFATFVAGNISEGSRLRKELGFLKPMMRRSFLQQHRLRYDERLRLGEDFALYANALALGAVLRVIPARTYVAVIRPKSISGHHSKQDLIRLRDSDEALLRSPLLRPHDIELLQRHSESIDDRIQWLNVIEAVKTRNIPKFVAAFFIRWSTTSFLVKQLLQQFVVRSRRAVDRVWSSRVR